jgi:putative methionine-R-sulfoxide reductase with GAF domain
MVVKFNKQVIIKNVHIHINHKQCTSSSGVT